MQATRAHHLDEMLYPDAVVGVIMRYQHRARLWTPPHGPVFVAPNLKYKKIGVTCGSALVTRYRQVSERAKLLALSTTIWQLRTDHTAL